ncbi:Synaptotagmin-like protein 4 [Nymphon striatum]|nr:Synaptotagmin-like protein 4 [Nymphon striatum]
MSENPRGASFVCDHCGSILSRVEVRRKVVDETDSITSVYSAAGTIGRYGIVKVSGKMLLSMNYDYKLGNIEVHIRECCDLAAVDAKKKRSDPKSENAVKKVMEAFQSLINPFEVDDESKLNPLACGAAASDEVTQEKILQFCLSMQGHVAHSTGHIKGYLLPDKSKSGKRKTKPKRHTLNPVFDEIMRFSVTISELETRTLWLTVWHVDRLGQNFFLGEITLPLGSDSLMLTEPTWFPLKERLEPSEYLNDGKGELHLSIKYSPPDMASASKRRKDDLFGADKEGSLHVLIKQARNLNSMHATYSSDPFCKCYLLPDKSRSGKQKTPVLKNTINPVWNHTFVYDRVTIDELKERCLELTIWDHDPITSNIFLGGVRFSLGLGTSREEPVSWMDSDGEEVRVWSEMVARENQWVDGTVELRPSMYVVINRNL